MTAAVLAMPSARASRASHQARTGLGRAAAITIATAYTPVYHLGEVNRCPACARSHFHIGRLSVECAFCCTAMPIAGGEA